MAKNSWSPRPRAVVRRRFRLVTYSTGRLALVDLDTREPVQGVAAVTIVARRGAATRVLIEYVALAEVEAEAEAAAVEVIAGRAIKRRRSTGQAAGGRARAAALTPERRRE